MLTTDEIKTIAADTRKLHRAMDDLTMLVNKKRSLSACTMLLLNEVEIAMQRVHHVAHTILEVREDIDKGAALLAKLAR